VESKWAELLEENPFVDRVVLLRRGSVAGLHESWRELRRTRYKLAIDFQGLIKSALVATAACPDRIYGFHHTQVRERSAALFYSNKTLSHAPHVVERNLDLAAAAGAVNPLHTFPLPAGAPEGNLPEGDFVLASPLAGWRGKQWPIEYYSAVALSLRLDAGIPLVINLPPGAEAPSVEGALFHYSGLRGLIDATRRATAVLGVDSGPMHLAAALSKPGVAIFGPTDPARNGPAGDSITVLRSPDAYTTYKRADQCAESMRRVSPAEVISAIRAVLSERRCIAQ
jgi:heptosyltransferase-1